MILKIGFIALSSLGSAIVITVFTAWFADVGFDLNSFRLNADMFIDQYISALLVAFAALTLGMLCLVLLALAIAVRRRAEGEQGRVIS